MLVSAGLLAGIAAGLFGIGGGIVSVPLMYVLSEPLGVHGDFSLFVAVSLLAIAVSSFVGVWTHHRAGNVRWKTGWPLAAGGAFGVGVGAYLGPSIREEALVIGFAGLLAWTARRMLYDETPLWTLHGTPALLVVGIAAGLVAKLFGIGGGILMVPVLVFAGHSMHAAVGTSLVAVFTNAVASTAWNLAAIPPGEWILWGLLLGLGSQLGAYVGARTGIRSQADALRQGFALLLVGVSFELVRRVLA